MNVTMIIPILLNTVLNTAVSYLFMKTKVINTVFVTTLATFPSPINAFLSTMDWKAVVLWFVLFAVDLAVFMPFVKAYDRQADKEDAQENA